MAAGGGPACGGPGGGGPACSDPGGADPVGGESPGGDSPGGEPVDEGSFDEDLASGEDWPQDDDQVGDHWPAIDPGDPVGDRSGSGQMPWPEPTPLLPPGPAALKNLPPVGSGFLDLRLPWLTLTQGGSEPGYLTRLGPITASQARNLALLATADQAVKWRIVLTNGSGQVIAVTRIRSRRSRAGPAGPAGPARKGRPASRSPTWAGPADPSSLLRTVTVIMSADDLSAAIRGGHEKSGGVEVGGDQRMGGDVGAGGGQGKCGGVGTGRSSREFSYLGVGGGQRECGDLGTVLAAIITAAREAVAQAAERAEADAAAGGCAHAQASPAYQVPTRLREFVSLRDLTCRFPTCRQPAWRCDADHTRPFDQDGPTCSCNLGPLCRYHHQLKQHQQWHLEQPVPGSFTWITPTGRAYTVQPDPQAA